MRRNRLHRDVLPVYNRPSVTVCWTLELLGGAWLRGEGERVALERKAAGLLAYLALEGPTPRGKLAGLLWPDAGDKGSRNNLRQCLYKLRPYTGLLVGDDPLCLRDVCVDALELQHHLDTADLERLAARSLAPPDLLAGLEYDDCPDFDEWLSVERERFKTRWLGALSSRADALEGEGDYRTALPLARALLIESPLSEVAHRRLMRLHSLLGDRAAALEVYQRCCEVLARELSVAPLPETCELARAIEEGAPLSRSALLPRYPTPFIGRARELAEIEALLLEPSCRLLVLTGPGGSGKTRLAVEAAAKVDATRDGHYFVPLSALNDSSLLVSAIASAIGFSFYSTTDPDTQLLEHLREKELLLVLDNFEHLREGAGFLLELLEGAPSVKLLLTSRERLGLPGEWVRELDGLPLPDSADIVEESEAAQLFLTNARRSAPRLALAKDERAALMRICRLTAGLPLALELASAWVWALSLEEIAAGLEESLAFLVSDTGGLPERHRSLWASFDHSWRLLPEAEKQALMKLSVFRGGFTAEAAAAVADAPLATLLSLMGRSLVIRDASGRFGMHEMLRQYAREKLGRGAHARSRRKHGTYYLRFVVEQGKAILGAGQKEALAVIDKELANIRTAWRWAVNNREADKLRQACRPLMLFFDFQSHNHEGIELCLQATGLSEAEPDHHVALGCVHSELAWLYFRVGRYNEATAAAERALALLRPSSERDSLAKALFSLGNVAWRKGAYEEARRHFVEALDLAKGLGHQKATVSLLNSLAIIEATLGNTDTAKRHYEEALNLNRQLSNHVGIISNLNNLGSLYLSLGEAARAKPFFEEALEVARGTGYQQAIPEVLCNLGTTLYELRALEQAEGCCKEALALTEESGPSYVRVYTLVTLGRVMAKTSRADQAKTCFEQGLNAARQINDTPAALAALIAMAELRLAQGEFVEATRWLSLASHHPATRKSERDLADNLLEGLRHKLPADTLRRALEGGRSMALTAVLPDALSSITLQ